MLFGSSAIFLPADFGRSVTLLLWRISGEQLAHALSLRRGEWANICECHLPAFVALLQLIPLVPFPSGLTAYLFFRFGLPNHISY